MRYDAEPHPLGGGGGVAMQAAVNNQQLQQRLHLFSTGSKVHVPPTICMFTRIFREVFGEVLFASLQMSTEKGM